LAAWLAAAAGWLLCRPDAAVVCNHGLEELQYYSDNVTVSHFPVDDGAHHFKYSDNCL
jgi:hypothetical protein